MSTDQVMADVAAEQSPAPATLETAMSTIDTVSSALPPASSTTTATALTADAPAVIVPAAEGPTEEEAAASRKRKLDGEQLEKKRSRRMFGLLQGTLNQAKEQTKKLSGVSQQRQELEERLARKLGEEKAAMEVQTLKLRQQRELQSEISAKETEMYTLDSMYKTRHAAKLNLASFLCTTFTSPPSRDSNDGALSAFAPRLPHAIRLAHPIVARPLYYLPYRLLTAQEDRIEDQIIAAERAIKDLQSEWGHSKKERLRWLDEAKDRRSVNKEENQRVRAQGRRERESVASETKKEREIGGGGDDGGDAVMETTVVVRETERSPSLSIRGIATSVRSESEIPVDADMMGMDGMETMVGGEEAIEY